MPGILLSATAAYSKPKIVSPIAKRVGEPLLGLLLYQEIVFSGSEGVVISGGKGSFWQMDWVPFMPGGKLTTFMVMVSLLSQVPDGSVEVNT